MSSRRRTSHRPVFRIVDAAAAGVTRNVANYSLERSRAIYVNSPPPEWVQNDPADDPREGPAGFRTSLLTAQERLTTRRRPNRSRTGTLRAMTDHVAALHAWRIR
jgi:hypothetical protein